MSKEKPNNDPRAKNDEAPTKGTNEPWDRANQKSQNPDEAPAPKPDLEKWQGTETH